MEEPINAGSSKRSLVSKIFRKFRSASPSQTSVLPPEFMKRYDGYFEWFYSPSSEYKKGNQKSRPPSYDGSQSLAHFGTTLLGSENDGFYDGSQSLTQFGTTSLQSEYVTLFDGSQSLTQFGTTSLQSEYVTLFDGSQSLTQFGTTSLQSGDVGFFDRSQSLAQLGTTSLESENDSLTTLIWELDSYPTKFTRKCAIFNSFDSGYAVERRDVKACRDFGCLFCTIIIKSFIATYRNLGAFSIRLDGPRNVIRITSVYNEDRSSINLEIYRSVKAIDNRELAESSAVPNELISTFSEESGSLDLDFSWVGSRPDVVRNDTNTDCLDQARIWLEQCRQKHSLCAVSQGKDKEQHPKRVIDVNKLRLREYENIDTGNKSYITLSHCWGGHQTYRTERDSLPSRLECMSWEDIPKTFQDAITVTRYLGFHYIWIDSLCIVQDDNEDWARESAKMSSIYANAVLTIAASAAADDTYGFLHQRQHVGVQIYPYQIHQTGHVIKVRRSIHRDLSQPGPLLKRAWVLQERCLSRRILFFEKHETTWECRELEDCECGSDLKDAKYKSAEQFKTVVHAGKYAENSIRNTYVFTTNNLRTRTSDAETFAWWRKTVVTKYATLALTHWTDRLPALSGLASTVKKKTMSTYLAGLWSNDLCSGLLWRASTTKPNHTDYLAPSWSWASHIGRVDYDWFPLEHKIVEFLDYQPTLASVDRNGYVHSAKLKLWCPTTKVKATRVENVPHQIVEFEFEKYCLMEDEIILSSTYSLDRPVNSISEATLAYVGFDSVATESRKIRVAGIILAPSAHSPGNYQRLGCWEAKILVPSERKISAVLFRSDRRRMCSDQFNEPTNPMYRKEIVIE